MANKDFSQIYCTKIAIKTIMYLYQQSKAKMESEEIEQKQVKVNCVRWMKLQKNRWKNFVCGMCK